MMAHSKPFPWSDASSFANPAMPKKATGKPPLHQLSLAMQGLSGQGEGGPRREVELGSGGEL